MGCCDVVRFTNYKFELVFGLSFVWVEEYIQIRLSLNKNLLADFWVFEF